MVANATTNPLSNFAVYRTPGKPFLMTEWNSGQPNDFGAETLLIAASYAAWQDWAGVFLFDYHSSGSYDRNSFDGFFSIDAQPAKMVTAPAAALIFRRPPNIEYSKSPILILNTNLSASKNSAVKTATTAAPNSVLSVQNDAAMLPGDALSASDSVTLTLPRDLTWNETASFADGPTASAIFRTWRGAGGVRSSGLQSRVYAQLGGGLFARSTQTTARTLSDSSLFMGDTQQMTWDAGKNIFCLNTPRSKVAVGFLGARFTQLGEWQIVMPQTQSNWASLSLTSLDGRDIVASKSLLLTAIGKAENIGMVWNADRSSVGNQWGTGPTRIEGILAFVRLATDLKQARVWALDATGARQFGVPSRVRNGVLSFAISSAWKTAWYQVEG